MTAPAEVTAAAPGPLSPRPYRVVGRRVELADVVTLALEPRRGRRPPFAHGQFNMLTAFGVGEAAISISSPPGAPGPIEHTIRDVGSVTHALCSLEPGGEVGVRGPFGTDWGVEDLDEGADVVMLAGGIGLAPLKAAATDLVERRRRAGGRVVVLAGARSPDQVLYPADLERWRRAGAHVAVSVDIATTGWTGAVGVVTTLIATAPFDPKRAVALVCGPEIMLRFACRALVDHGVDPTRIRVSLERNMQCGIGLCGHCQLGPILVCRDGPVVAYGGLADELLSERQR